MLREWSRTDAYPHAVKAPQLRRPPPLVSRRPHSRPPLVSPRRLLRARSASQRRLLRSAARPPPRRVPLVLARSVSRQRLQQRLRSGSPPCRLRLVVSLGAGQRMAVARLLILHLTSSPYIRSIYICIRPTCLKSTRPPRSHSIWPAGCPNIRLHLARLFRAQLLGPALPLPARGLAGARPGRVQGREVCLGTDTTRASTSRLPLGRPHSRSMIRCTCGSYRAPRTSGHASQCLRQSTEHAIP